MHPLARQVLSDLDLAPQDWRTTTLSAAQIASADLVLTAEADHRRAVVALHPKAVRRTFTLARFAELATGLRWETSGARSGADLLNQCLIAATRKMPGPDAGYNLNDPMGGDIDDFRDCAATIEEAVSRIFQQKI